MFQAKTDKKAAIFMAPGCEEIEALTVVDILFRAGIPLTKVSITDSLSVTSSHDVTFLTDEVIDSFSFEGYDMLILPGGMPGTTNLGACGALTDQVSAFAKAGKYVAAICAAPSVLAALGLLKGRRAACNPSVEQKLLDGGADLVREPVCVDGNLITSRAMGTAIPFALAITEALLDKETADALRANILYDPEA